MPFETSRTRCALALLVLPLVAGLGGSVAAQTAPFPEAAAKPAAPVPPNKPKVEKSVRLDKHAGPWTVIWHTRLWTDVPETQDFVKATHPDPKKLEYAPLIGKDPDRPKPRDAKGIAALQAELEGDIKANAARGKAINDMSAAAPAKATKVAKRSARSRKSAKVSAASKPSQPD